MATDAMYSPKAIHPKLPASLGLRCPRHTSQLSFLVCLVSSAARPQLAPSNAAREGGSGGWVLGGAQFCCVLFLFNSFIYLFFWRRRRSNSPRPMTVATRASRREVVPIGAWRVKNGGKGIAGYPSAKRWERRVLHGLLSWLFLAKNRKIHVGDKYQYSTCTSFS